MKLLNGSWIVQLLGCTALITYWGNVITMLTDGKPETNPDWGVAFTLTALALGNIFSKDFNVSNAPNPTPEGEKLQKP